MVSSGSGEIAESGGRSILYLLPTQALAFADLFSRSIASMIGKPVHELQTLKMNITIATPGEDNGRRRGKLEVRRWKEPRGGLPSPKLASSPNNT